MTDKEIGRLLAKQQAEWARKLDKQQKEEEEKKKKKQKELREKLVFLLRSQQQFGESERDKFSLVREKKGGSTQERESEEGGFSLVPFRR